MDETVVISSDESSDARDPPLPEKKGFVLKRVQTDEEWFSKVGLRFKKKFIDRYRQCCRSMTFCVDPDLRIHASDYWIRIRIHTEMGPHHWL